MVTVASNIVVAQLETASEIAKVDYGEFATQIIDEVKKRGLTDVAATLQENKQVLEAWLTLDSEDTSKGLHEMLQKEVTAWTFGFDVVKKTDTQYKNLATIIEWAVSNTISLSELENILLGVAHYYDGSVQYLTEERVKKIFGDKYWGFIKECGELYENNQEIVEINGVKEVQYYTGGASLIWSEAKNDSTRAKVNKRYYWSVVLNDLKVLKKAAVNQGSNSQEEMAELGARLIPDLATYFKDNAHSTEIRKGAVTGVGSVGNIQIQNMIMYSILVVQSLILFISYIKRLFYVILLAMMAPVVVVFDFFQKFGK